MKTQISGRFTAVVNGREYYHGTWEQVKICAWRFRYVNWPVQIRRSKER